ncbi:MAG: 2-amino-4-hydroxy-6-hydroxymethyldihydropteridine diphosphokinase [Lachnospiraceae bacterium]|nr:2-amino-4-hydroxy-6-hydroxymethyldihydropteridine diphosphokinase [Lachnospiraceae bacterium]
MSEYFSDSIIRIDGLKLMGKHGVHPEEKETPHPFVFDISYSLDTSRAAATDYIGNTISYSDVVRTVKKVNGSRSFDLIEALADTAAKELLTTFRPIKTVTVKVSKPEAPVKEEFEDISATVKRSWHRIAISFGSNEGDSIAVIEGMLDDVEESGLFRDMKVSEVIRTTPYGVKDQPDFLNGCILAYTFLSPGELLSFCLSIEQRYGRVRTMRWGPRTLDMDIIFYDDLIIDEPDLTIPHYDMKNREFVLKPLSEIAGYIMHPVFMKTVNEMYAELCEKSGKE